MKGLPALTKLWQRPKPEVAPTPFDVAFSENKWRLLRYRARPAGIAHKTPVLLVPSLINRHYVLDLMPGKSFAESMVARGFDVYVIDWGTPDAEDRFVTFDDVAWSTIKRCLRVCTKIAGTEQAHVLGYCLGGTLVVAHAGVDESRIASLVLLAAPVEFRDDGILSKWTNTKSFDLDAVIDATGNVPWQLMQFAFTLIRPTLPLSKGVMLLDRAWNDEFLDGFLALETWGNDNVSFPGEAYRKYIRDLYRDDALVKGTFSLGGKRAKLEAITRPTMVVTFEHDEIVPWKSAAVLMDKVSSTVKEHVHLPGGHVGAVVSKTAAKGLWPKLAAFWEKHGTAALTPVPSIPISSAAPIPHNARMDTFDAALVPQKSLGAVRHFLVARVAGGTGEAMAAAGFEERAAGYAENAATALGFVDDARALTETAHQLLATIEGSEAERGVFRHALLESKLYRELVPDLLDANQPDLAELSVRLAKRANLSAATAKRRAQELLGWRKALFVVRAGPAVFTQLALPLGDDHLSDSIDVKCLRRSRHRSSHRSASSTMWSALRRSSSIG